MFDKLTPPKNGSLTTMTGGGLNVPDEPIVPFIEGDGTGPDIWRAAVRVFDAAVEKAYGGKRRIAWFEVFAASNIRYVNRERLAHHILHWSLM